MNQEILALAASGNRKLVLHALQRWERECPRDPEPLLAAVKSDDPDILKLVLPLARRFFPAQFAPQILELLYHEQFLHRRLGVESLEPSMGKDAPGCLYQLLQKESHPHVLASAVLAAPRLTLGLDAIVGFLTHADPRVRANTIRAVSAYPGDHRTLLEPFLRDPALRVQNEAIKTLARLVPQKKLDELLLKRIAFPKAEVRAATAMLIADLPVSSKAAYLQPLLGDPDPAVVSCAARALAKGNDPAGIRAIAESYFSSPLSPLLKVLRSCAPQPILLEAGKHGEPSRADAKIVLRTLEIALDNPAWEAFLPWILAAAAHSSEEVRLPGLELIRRNATALSGSQHRIDEILEKAKRSRNPKERAIAARVSLKMGRLIGLETLTAMLRDNDSATRAAAAEALHQEASLLTRKALQEARTAGIREAFTSGPGITSPGS